MSTVSGGNGCVQSVRSPFQPRADVVVLLSSSFMFEKCLFDGDVFFPSFVELISQMFFCSASIFCLVGECDVADDVDEFFV